MIWIPLVLALLAEPIVQGDLILRPCMPPQGRGGKSRGKHLLRRRDLGPTAAPPAVTFEEWEKLAEKIRVRGLLLRGETAA